MESKNMYETLRIQEVHLKVFKSEPRNKI